MLLTLLEFPGSSTVGVPGLSSILGLLELNITYTNNYIVYIFSLTLGHMVVFYDLYAAWVKYLSKYVLPYLKTIKKNNRFAYQNNIIKVLLTVILI